jgi:hypothetical protein
MDIDDRLARLAERYRVLEKGIKLVTADLRKIRANFDRRAAEVSRLQSRIRSFETAALFRSLAASQARMIAAMARLDHIK